MSDEKFPSQEKHSEKIPKKRMEQLEDELSKSTQILEQEGLYKGIEEEEEEEGEIEEEGVEPEKRPETTQESPIDDWQNQVEQMDKFKHFTRTDIAEMIARGASDEEIWAAAKEAGVFFKFDGSSYYLSNSEQKDRGKDDEGAQNKYQWRRRSANNNTSGGYQEGNMFGHIKRELGLYRDLQDAYPSLKDAFAAANMLQAYGEKPTRNKILSMSEYWNDIKSANSESITETTEEPESSEEEGAEAEEVISEEEYKKFINEGVVTDSVIDHVTEKVKNSEELTDRENEIFTDKTSEINEKIKEIAETEEKTEREPDTDTDMEESAAESAETQESAEEISKGDKVYYMEKEMRRWRDPKEIIAIKTVDDEKYAKFADDDSLYPVKKLALAESSAEDKDYQPGPENAGDNLSAEDVEDVPDAEKVSEEVEMINQTVADEFESQFEISAQDLAEKVPGFVGLTDGQQKLVLDNFKQLTLSRIEEEGIEEYREDKNNSSAVAGMWKGFLSSYYKNKHITETGKQLLSGGIDMHQAALTDVVQSTKESGLDLGETGDLVFARSDDFEDLTEEERAIVEEFNNASQSFAQTAVEWEYEDGWSKLTGGNREAYQDRRDQYEEALNHYIDLLIDRKGWSPGLKEGAEIDKKVRFAQFFAGDSKYENALQNIKSDASWKQLLGTVGREKGAYMAMGMVSRTSAVGLINTIAAPIVATGIGGAAIGAGLGAYKGRSSAVETLRDDAKLGSGGGQEQSELVNTVPAEQLTEKLRDLIDKVEDPDISREERGGIAASLARRIRYTEQKINGGKYLYEDEDGNEQVAELSGGLVDYGDVDGRSGRQYQLLQTLNEARAIGIVHDPDVNEEINNRLDKYLDYKDEKTRDYVREKTRRGAVYAGAFGGVLGTIAGLGIFGGDDTAEVPDTEELEGEGGVTTDTTETNPFETGGDSATTDATEANLLETGGDSVATESTDVETAQPDSADTNPFEAGSESVEGDLIGSETITIDEDGEGMIHAIADKLEDEYNLSHDKAMEIGNQLYVKGEQLDAAADDEMFNLVGKGASFKLDFGDLQAADLESRSAEDLAEAIDFDNTEIDPGDSGVEPELEVPEPPQDAPGYGGEGSEAAATDGQYEDNPVEHIDKVDVPSAAEAQNMSGEELESWKQELEEEGIIIDEDNTSGSSESSDVETSGENAPQEADSGESAAGTESSEAEVPENMSESELREIVSQENVANDINDQIESMLSEARALDTSKLGNISVSSLNELQEYLYANSDQNLITTIEQMRGEEPRLLLTLDRVVSADENPPGSLMDQLDQFISGGINDKAEEIGQSLEEEAAVTEAHADAVSSAEADEDTKERVLAEADRLEDQVRELRRHTGYGDKTLDRISSIKRLLR